MITKWKVFNFKSIQKETELDFAPLTIFAGANSSGKSTLIQSILLIAQTLSHKIGQRPIILNGTLTRLGQFDDLRSSDSAANEIAIGWECQPTPDPFSPERRPGRYTKSPAFYVGRRLEVTKAACDITFDADPSDPQRDLLQLQPRLFSCQLSSTCRDQDGADTLSSIIIRRPSLPSIDNPKAKWIDAAGDSSIARSSLDYDITLDEASLTELHEDLVSAEPVGCLFRHFLPDRLSLGVDQVEEEANLICSVILGDPISRSRPYLDRDAYIPSAVIRLIRDSISSEVDDYLQYWQEWLSDNIEQSIPVSEFMRWIRRLPPSKRHQLRKALSEAEDLDARIRQLIKANRNSELALMFFALPKPTRDAVVYLDRFFSGSLKYLGPLRDEPKPIYPLTPSVDPSDVGLRGEHTASVLDIHKNLQIRYMPSSHFKNSQVQRGTVIRSLETAVVDWLEYLGVAEAVETKDKGKLGHELHVSISGTGKPHDLTHVGVGVSQVLPILVACLLADTDSTIILEQPELHLHPKVQTLLGDFFLSMTMLGKQCIVETHSEYLINRLRFRVAASGEENPWIAAMKIYFTERSEEGSSFREVKVNEYGAVLEWPDGFFDQSQLEAEAILRAAATKRKSRRGK